MATQPDDDRTLIWRKSRASGPDSGCVEIATSKSLVLIRDSRDRSGPRLGFRPASWRRFLRRIHMGDMPLG
jgi:Domain of unknown function (DUF397)